MASEVAQEIALLESENVKQDVRPSWSRWSGSVVFGLATSWLLIGLIILLVVWLKRRNTQYIVTNQRLLEVTGILGTNTTEYRIADLRQIQTGATLVEKILGHGNLQFSTGAVSMIKFSGIPNYQEVANTIRQMQQKVES